MRFSELMIVVSFLALPLVGQDKLPVKRVVLYKNGVGYFEHLGHVKGSQDVTISFTSEQLNDVLKSLTVLDLDGGRVTGVTYGSPTPVDRQLADLRISASEKSTLADFLGALRGARAELKNGPAVITGRILSVERKSRTSNNVSQEIDYVSLLMDTGEVRTMELSPAVSVRLLEKELAGKVNRFLDLVSSTREVDMRQMVVATAGTGDRSLFVSYISEVPIWKTTYRIVLPSKTGESPLLQGWAIVDNTVGQDWDNVQLSLVAGAPQSFIQKLSQPYFARRPEVPLPEDVNFSPQMHEATLYTSAAQLSGLVTDASGAAVAGVSVKAYDAGGQLKGEVTSDLRGMYEFAALEDGVYRLEFEAPGFNNSRITGVRVSSDKPVQKNMRLNVGSVTETVTVEASKGRLPGTLGSGAALGRSGVGAGSGPGIGSGMGGGIGPGVYRVQQPIAAAKEIGDLFEYKLKEPITIHKNQSALVPIVQAPVGAEKVSIWNEQARLPRPQRALWLNNSSGLTLEGGSFSVLDEQTFAGEGIFEPIKPGEKRLISYATDLAVTPSSKSGTERQRVTRVRVSRGVMVHESEIREKKTYTFRNEDDSPRTIIVEHPVRKGLELRGDLKPAETSAQWMRFRLKVPPKETASLVVEEGRPTETTYRIANITSDEIGLFVSQQSINKELEGALRQIIIKKDALEILKAKKQALDADKGAIFDDQQRVRENLKALKGTAEEKALVQRYTRQLNDEETRLQDLQKQIEQAEAQQAAAQAELNGMMEALAFDVKL